jgi:hypothetical protein
MTYHIEPILRSPMAALVAARAAPTPRVIRVFVSSTFRDMQEERDVLVKQIFPQLRKLCESRAASLPATRM